MMLLLLLTFNLSYLYMINSSAGKSHHLLHKYLWENAEDVYLKIIRGGHKL